MDEEMKQSNGQGHATASAATSIVSDNQSTSDKSTSSVPSASATSSTSSLSLRPLCPRGSKCERVFQYMDRAAHDIEFTHDASLTDKFDMPFQAGESVPIARESAMEAYTLRELAMMAFAAAVREKPHWWNKINNKSLVAKWIAEAQQQEPLLNDRNAQFMIDELKWQAQQRKINAPIQPSVTDGIWQADGLVSAELKNQLLAAVAQLENVPTKSEERNSE